MTWAKIDDGFPQHPKVIGLSDAAFRLYVTALAYCSRHLTDGELPEAALPTLYPRRTRALAVELVKAGLWHDETHECAACPPIVSGRFQVHGFLDYNPTGDEVREGQERRSDKARRAALARWHGAPEHAPSNAQASERSMLPDAPSRPVLSSNSSVNRSHAEPADPVDNEDDEKHLARQVLERIADTRMANQTGIKDRMRYRATVLDELQAKHHDRLLKLIHTHPLAPVDCLAGAILDEPNSLHLYRTEAAG